MYSKTKLDWIIYFVWPLITVSETLAVEDATIKNNMNLGRQAVLIASFVTKLWHY